MQTADSVREAGGFCRSEFQAFCKYFAVRLIQRAIAERYALPESATVKLPHGQTFCQTVDTWREQLQGAHECLVPSSVPATEVPPGHWRAFKNVPTSAYKPTTGEGEWPFFVSLDRSSCHSFWTGNKRKVHLEEPGIPLLQWLKMPPRGHDVHQIVEHAIGALKNYVNKVFGHARALGRALTTALMVQAMKEGSKLYTAESWDRNFPKLMNCLRIIAAEEGMPVEMTITTKAGKQRKTVQPGTGGGYAPVRMS